MQTYGRGVSGAVVCGVLLMLSGCASLSPLTGGDGKGWSAPSARQESVPAPAVVAPEPAPAPPAAPDPVGYRLSPQDPVVAERMAFFQGKERVWHEAASRWQVRTAGGALPEAWQRCRQHLDTALAGYRRLRSASDPGLNPWEVLAQDVRYFEDNCERQLVLAQAEAALGKEAQSAPQPLDQEEADRLRRMYAAGQYEETVAACEALTRAAGGQNPADEVREHWGRALVKLGRFREAAGMLAPLLPSVPQERQGREIALGVLSADALLAAGQVDAARVAYDGLARTLAPLVDQQAWIEAQAKVMGQGLSPAELASYREVIQAYLRFDGRRVPQAMTEAVAALEARSAGAAMDAARMVLAMVREQSAAWCQGQLDEVRALLAARDLGQARTLLDQVSAAAPEEMAEAISRLQMELSQAGAGTAAPQGEVSSPWDQAMALLEQQRYDEAIAAFTSLAGGPRALDAKEKIAEAAERAAGAMRQQAAALYAKARKTATPEARRQALLDSQALLRGLIDKYPTAKAVSKARQNLQVIETELSGLPVVPPAVSP